MPHATLPPPSAPPVAPPAPVPAATPGFAEQYDDPAQAEELERQQDA